MPPLPVSIAVSDVSVGWRVQDLELEAVQLVDGLLAIGGDGAYRSCNGFTEPLRARLRAGGLLWVGGAALVRKNGSGQWRHGLAAVLGGWAKVAAGRVLLAGDDLALLPLSEVRRQVVVVPREPLVVSGTVRQNLDLLGKAQGDWEIWAALEQCFFADTVRSWPGETTVSLRVIGPRSLVLPCARCSPGARSREILTCFRALCPAQASLIVWCRQSDAGM